MSEEQRKKLVQAATDLLQTSGETTIRVDEGNGEIHFRLKNNRLSPVPYPIHNLVKTDSNVIGEVKLFEGNLLLQLNATLITETTCIYEITPLN